MKLSPMLKTQIEEDIVLCEQHIEPTGSERLYSELVARYTVLDSRFTEGLSMNGKVAPVGSEYDYRPELHAISSKLKMLLLVDESGAQKLSPLLYRVEEFIRRGEAIEKTENTSPGKPITVVAGPQFEVWINEINIFNERHLKNHPLYNEIFTTCFHRKNINAFSNMMGHLRALASDDEFWKSTDYEENVMVIRSRKTLDQLLAEDIDRCEQFLINPNDEAAGQKLYVEITGRYDTIISGLGNGLYQYFAKQHFYDPAIKGSALTHNLTVLLNKMISFQAEKYPPKDAEHTTESNNQINNKVFIVHGHDNEAILDIARTLEKGGFESIILHEQPDAGLTIIEKIERYAHVCYAVILYTECDKGREKNESIEQERYRARQNVVFEHGYLIGKLGRERVSAIVKGNVETPGDISGVVYISMDKGGAWKRQLAKNMQDVGLPIDMNTFFR